MRVSLRSLCLLCFLIPIITIIISFVWSANLNLVSWCIPNFEGCTSISRVGRYEPVKYFFKPLMFIYAVFLYYFWKKYYEFLSKNKINLSKFLIFLAYCSILFLVLYIFFLGEGKLYRFFRQVGIFIYIFFIIFLNVKADVVNKKYFKDEKGVLAIMYHRFEENKYPSTNIRLDIFKKHINLIKENNINFYDPAAFKALAKRHQLLP